MSKKQPVRPVGQKPRVQTEGPGTVQDFQVSNKVLLPALVALCFVMALIYCKPILQGMQLSTHDSNQYIAMNKEVADFKAQTGENLLWSSRMFGGMPAFMLGGLEFASFSNYLPLALLHKVLRVIPDPAMEIVFLLVCSFIGLYVLTRKPLLAFLGAVAIGFCTANFVSLDAGHITKVITISMFLPLFAAAWLTFRKQYAWGFVLFLVFLYEIVAGAHVQIAYYSLILVGIYGVYEVVSAIVQKEVKHAAIASGLLIGALVIAGCMNFQNYFVNDFSKDTTRGGDILHFTTGENQKEAKEEGVGFDYATRWSFGYEELGSLLVPDFAGGSSGASLDASSATYATLTGKGVPPEQAAQFVSRLPLYWGSEPFVQGPIYLGAIVIFLFVFGMFAYKERLKWWLLGGIIFTVLIALGKNFETFYRLLFNVVPMFNKFRAPTMILALTQVMMVLTGVLGLAQFFDGKTTTEDRMRTLKFSGSAIAGLLLIFWLLGPSLFPFQSTAPDSSDPQFRAQLTQMTGNAQFANDIFSSLMQDRKSAMQSDALRSLIFVLLTVGVLFTFIKGYVKQPGLVAAALAVLVLLDFWPVSKRYLNDNDFAPKAEVEANAFPLTPADQAILSDNKDGARMIDLSGDVFNSASPAYYHRTSGGYNPAKLRRYQDIIEHGLSYDLGENAKNGLPAAHYLNMLNTRYLKNGTEVNSVIQNPYALGNAWMVNSIQWVNTNEDEIMQVRQVDPAKTAIVHKEFEKYLHDFMPAADSAMSDKRFVKLANGKNPMKLEYTFKSPSKAFVVFSEVIYRPNEDWISYIDGKPAEHIRVNYILRGMIVPEGEHTITFEFKPKKYATTNSVISAGYALFYLSIGIALFLWFRKRKANVPEADE